MTYQLTSGTNILRISDGAYIPNDPKNSDYQAYLAWVAEGNTATPYVAPTPTIQSQISALEALQTPRRMREAANGTDAGWLKNLDAQIVALRAQIKTIS